MKLAIARLGPAQQVAIASMMACLIYGEREAGAIIKHQVTEEDVLRGLKTIEVETRAARRILNGCWLRNNK